MSSQAHLSPSSDVVASFQPSWTEKKLSGSVIASEYSWPMTMLQLSKTPLPKLLLLELTACSPHTSPSTGQFVFCQGMNAYWTRAWLPRPSTEVVCEWYPQ